MSPPIFEPSASPVVLLAVWGGLAVAAFIYAVVLGFRHRDVLPVVACIGALVCALNEPIYDTLGVLVYAHVPSMFVAYTSWGREIPWTLVIGYLPWVGLMPYLIYRAMAGGASRSTLHKIAFGLFLSVALVELLNLVWWDNWRYYGEVPIRGLLSGGIIQMAAMPMLAALLYLMLDRPSGTIRRIVLGIVVPCISLPMIFASTSWPMYVANYSNVPDWLSWVAAGISIALCVAAVPVISGLAVRWREAA